jgi:hypothetical protein
MRRSSAWCAPLIVCGLSLLFGVMGASTPLPAVIPGGPTQAPSAEPDPGSSRPLTDDLVVRLSALDPSRPMMYFELGEELVADMRTPARRDLARRLFVLAMHLERQGGRPGRLGPGACLALASIEPREEVARWLAATAQVLDAELAAADPDSPRVRPVMLQVPWPVGLAAAEVLGLVRGGDGRLAEERLREPGVRRLLETYEAALDAPGQVGGMTRVLRAIEETRNRCPECQGRRFVVAQRPLTPGTGPRPAGTGTPQAGSGSSAPTGARGGFVLCERCRGVWTPRMSSEEIIADLRFESMLLRGVHRSWAAQALADGGRPLLDPDPGAVASLYMIDTAASVFRDGRWVAPLPANVPSAP